MRSLNFDKLVRRTEGVVTVPDAPAVLASGSLSFPAVKDAALTGEPVKAAVAERAPTTPPGPPTPAR